MEFVSSYVSHQPDDNGYISYSSDEHSVWQLLYDRQMKALPGIACNQFLEGLKALDFCSEKIPQLPEVSIKLSALTGWKVEPVAALISAREFFELLASKRFPAATFIRRLEELDYVKEPDIFHELFGHCPMLTNPIYADFVHKYACKVLELSENNWPLLQRLFWFTVEYGLIHTPQGLRAYGGGILSSIKETVYSIKSDIPMHIYFDPVVAFRTPYRIDMIQPVYFVIDDYQVLYNFVNQDLESFIDRARELGEYPPMFPVDPNNPNIHILAC